MPVGTGSIGECAAEQYVPLVADTIVTRAPTRIDFGGGWTDVPPYSDEMGGYVCNVAINRYVTVTIGHAAASSLNPSERVVVDAAARRLNCSVGNVHIASDFPIGAGLGGSSAAGVAVLSAMCAATDSPLSRDELAELSRDIEVADLGVSGGRQDHYAAAYGGALGLRFGANGVVVDPIALSPRVRDALERRCIIIYTGQSRISGDTIEGVLGAYRAREPRVVGALQPMKELAESMTDALRREDVDELGALVGEQWQHQRSLHPAIPTERIDAIIATAARTGAIGSKALGASGGGCVLVISAEGREAELREVLAPLGQLLPFAIDLTGAARCR